MLVNVPRDLLCASAPLREAQCHLLRRNPRPSGCLPVDLSRSAPKLIERVIFAGRFVEQMDHDVAVVEQDPIAHRVSFLAHPLVVKLFDQFAVDFLGHRVHLAAAATSCDYKVIEDRGQLAQVEHLNVFAAIVECRLSCDHCALEGAVGLGVVCRLRCCCRQDV